MARHYYWFEPEDGLLGYGDGRKPVAGEAHTVSVRPVPCQVGLHASRHPADALLFPMSAHLWRVALSGVVAHDEYVYCATERTYIARIDATDLLRRFAQRCALDVIDLWDAPDVVRQYLRTGDESMSLAARDAARDAEGWDGYGETIWTAAGYAAAAALSAARIARNTKFFQWFAKDAAGYARSAAAAWDAEMDAPLEKIQRRRFAKMVNEAFREAHP